MTFLQEKKINENENFYDYYTRLVAELPPTKFNFHTVKVPGYGAWVKCTKLPTTFISYVIRCVNPNAQVDPMNYGGDFYDLNTPQANTNFYGKYGKGFTAMTVNFTDYLTGSVCGEIDTEGFTSVAYICEKDVTSSILENWCLSIFNPFYNDQKVEVVVSFIASVFVDGSYRKDPNQIPASISKQTFSINKVNKKRNLRRVRSLRPF
ncbi:20297_t:CDS:2 [Funneliformis geosporum]|uniref:5311_t:CDS:1 n=1 Tax=Funneliformis geosporum TaxID=1117311 RepID=A0A9W4SSG6_9GLOM|nr:20297_t:CDS:2 [Funneliformis geosporum]CAI2179224.1 5311_t:CDS:2 [Funneliformis geosporum]